ncbi:aminotransferase class I/II-fold pyridoxal phosphate-dependent enzyme [Candidatus Bathyarchaeota archaeon]|nr:aminotransferase class I/II-fold pyridoxal phosphate-dependent enzyme [Candidatus Bathyarchaeota archaeon]
MNLLTEKDEFGSSTKCVHSGTETDPSWGSVVTPIYQTTTYSIPDVPELIELYSHKKKGYTYTSTGNPTQRAAEKKIAALEGGEDAAVFSAGMGAITATINSLVRNGDEVIAQNDLYGETFRLFKTMPEMRGVKSHFFNAARIDEVEDLINEKTRLLYLETPTNPLLKLVDIEKATEIARDHGVTTILDNTFASPLNQRGLDLGVDIVVESATKSLSGHHHVVCGAAISTKKHIKAIKHMRGDYGQTLDPFGAFLLITGMQTMSLRIERMNANALALAEFLEESPKVERVYYPGLPSHPQHDIAKKQMHGFGSMVSFKVKGGLDAITHLFNHLELVKLATSLGGVDTIATIPCISTHGGLSKEAQLKVGITENLVRASIGIEDYSDLENDFKNALSHL